MTTAYPPAPNPDMIAMMIQADPTLQNVDPTLIAMGITGTAQHRATAIFPTPPAKQLPNSVSHAGGSKRCWQEVVTPLSYNVPTAKKPKKQRKDKRQGTSVV
jgi:hypothetical protein